MDTIFGDTQINQYLRRLLDAQRISEFPLRDELVSIMQEAYDEGEYQGRIQD